MEPTDPALTPIIAEVPEDFSDLVPDYLDGRRAELTTIPEALARGDFKQIRTWGHNMAGTGGGLGFEEITLIGRALEEAAVSSDSAAITASVKRLEKYLAALKVVFVP